MLLEVRVLKSQKLRKLLVEKFYKNKFRTTQMAQGQKLSTVIYFFKISYFISFRQAKLNEYSQIKLKIILLKN
jgi:hypothetical protein